jgi:hypothetical protein
MLIIFVYEKKLPSSFACICSTFRIGTIAEHTSVADFGERTYKKLLSLWLNAR